MAKARTIYSCQSCGGTTLRWQGQCPHCREWNTLEETREQPLSKAAVANRFEHLAASSTVRRLADVQMQDTPRMSTGLAEFDRVLGGGLVAGSVVLIGGDPGIGKSTLLLQVLTSLSFSQNVLYVTGEESDQQVALRAKRLELNTESVQLLAEIQLEAIQRAVAEVSPKVVVIDSIQTMFSSELTAAPGSVSQVRECAAQLTRLAKQNDIALVMIGHVTKDGSLAGPRVLEHIVDTVLYFEGDSHSSHRLIRAFKNRFGAVNELGVFAMTDKGLRGINNPSAIFLSQHSSDIAGSCVMATQEGTRPLLVEIQALADTAHVPNPRRLSLGLDGGRLAMLLAVLHRHGGIPTFNQDVFINAVGGVRISETASDLPVILALISSLRDKPLPKGFFAFGEVGLAGEIRPATRGQERLKEAAKLGFEIAMIPKHNAPKQPLPGLTIWPVSRLVDIFDYLRRE
ncbi:DNA repair protein RadA [Oligella urethralis]|uniref:DNA repair protein RadA n=1 Tax=Oligella urethralis TaxID=90245 RepID=UPI0006616DD0|nr:DNA repair protein RadA [Oligella urethralis]AVL71255.1 DNA repair protein RadA [Oligella urethralis]MDK6203666.1 DNA repair protein RadA [Oligella urethralis]PMC17132.1 DNA repair protein RadA [Oligella urethralis]WOS37908.1 DNA repair protein RadA [Oligella urethralis]SUA60173.1 Circadian clock protein kinase kaiC [Oligella urethralis]